MGRLTSPRRITAWTLVAAGGLIVIGVLGVLALNHWVYTPARAALGYLTAVGNGDSHRALALLNPRGLDSANRAALSKRVLSGASDLPEDFDLAGTRELSDGRVAVTYDYTLNDSRASATFVAEKGPSRWLVFNDWRLRPEKLPRLTITVPGSSTVAINGVRLELGSSTQSLPVLFPATYTVGYSSKYVRASPESVTVSSHTATPDDVTLSLTATPALGREVHRQIKASLTACADATVLAPSGCPFAVNNDNKILGRVSWTINKVPTVELSRAHGAWVMADATGEATASGTEMDIVTAKKSKFRTSSTFEYSATVRIADGRVLVMPKFD
ncbi:hypothetical protein [Spelaeicoccus albus]|uniref:Uncharacterized protein n=1 Tax=Spelaeicoccus albus TaxID=1280376 RepID=A0A7Z0AB17_9MICO|nr:hypothetical protein [Spelaeicoccus albus]NYI66358.1 hypothetical protein [Spelaeicoccus albus]